MNKHITKYFVNVSFSLGHFSSLIEVIDKNQMEIVLVYCGRRKLTTKYLAIMKHSGERMSYTVCDKNVESLFSF